MSKLKTPLKVETEALWVGIYDADGKLVMANDFSDTDRVEQDISNAHELADAVNGQAATPAPSLPSPLLPLLAAWIMRAWHFGADVDPGLLEWARVNEDGSTQLNHLTLEAVKGGAK